MLRFQKPLLAWGHKIKPFLLGIEILCQANTIYIIRIVWVWVPWEVCGVVWEVCGYRRRYVGTMGCVSTMVDVWVPWEVC